jgi:hypothetical protein
MVAALISNFGLQVSRSCTACRSQSSALSVRVNEGLKPETTNNWEIIIGLEVMQLSTAAPAGGLPRGVPGCKRNL